MPRSTIPHASSPVTSNRSIRGIRLAAAMLASVMLFGGRPCLAQPEAGATSQEVTFTSGDATLAGTLTLPPGKGPHPAAILLSGNGPHDRDGALQVVPDYRPFAVIAEHLAKSGFAVLRCDDRGVGKSTGDYLAAGEEDFFKDAEAALQFMLKREDIAAKRIGLIGHSEGAMIAAVVAGRRPEVAFVVNLAGGATKGYDLLVRQTERAITAEGKPSSQVAEAVANQRRMLDLVLAQDWDKLQEIVREVSLKRLRELPPQTRARIGDLEAAAIRHAEQSMQTLKHPRYRFMIEHDFGADWTKVKVPVLAIFGGLDVQCDAAQNQEGLERALREAGNKNVKTVIIRGANHLLIPARAGAMSEYATLPKDFAPGVLDTLSTWLTEQAKP
ncbi:MAG: alpha/beta fold hydrolase [Phycisphaerae bacterium]